MKIGDYIDDIVQVFNNKLNEKSRKQDIKRVREWLETDEGKQANRSLKAVLEALLYDQTEITPERVIQEFQWNETLEEE